MSKEYPANARHQRASFRRLFRSKRIGQVFPAACLASFIVGIAMAPDVVNSGNLWTVVGAGLVLGLVGSLLVAGILKLLDFKRSQEKERERGDQR
jgi:hypothetical protein